MSENEILRRHVNVSFSCWHFIPSCVRIAVNFSALLPNLLNLWWRSIYLHVTYISKFNLFIHLTCVSLNLLRSLCCLYFQKRFKWWEFDQCIIISLTLMDAIYVFNETWYWIFDLPLKKQQYFEILYLHYFYFMSLCLALFD